MMRGALVLKTTRQRSETGEELPPQGSITNQRLSEGRHDSHSMFQIYSYSRKKLPDFELSYCTDNIILSNPTGDTGP